MPPPRPTTQPESQGQERQGAQRKTHGIEGERTDMLHAGHLSDKGETPDSRCGEQHDFG